MSLVAYLACSVEPELVPWDEAAPAFWVSPLRDEDEPVRDELSLPHVVRLGGHEGDASTFGHPVSQRDPDDEEIHVVRADFTRLAHYVRDLVLAAGAVELYACAEGEQGLAVLSSRELPVSALFEPGFSLPDRALLRVSELPPG